MKWMPVYMVIGLLIAWSNNSTIAYDFCENYSNDTHYNITHTPRADVIHRGQGTINIPDPVYVPLTIELAKTYDIDLPLGGELDAQFGMMEIYKDGRILYDGRDISSQIESACIHDPSQFEAITEQQTTENGDNPDA